MVFISDVHSKLGLNPQNGLFIRKDVPKSNTNIIDLYDGDFTDYKYNFKVEYALMKLEPHSFFLLNNEPILLFFDFQNTNSVNKSELSKKIWNFNKSAIIFINYKTELVIYNGFDIDPKDNILKILETINLVANSTQLEKYSYWKIISSELWYENDAKFKNNLRVDYKLLENIKATREILIDINSEYKLKEEYANIIIARLIFVRYLIDRKVTFDYYGTGYELLTSKKDLPNLILQKEYLYEFFDYLAIKFNGSLLPVNGEREAIKPEHLEVLSNLFAGNQIKTRQDSLFNVFDFDFIPIELISNIYETFLGEKQDSDKAFYTPPFLVDYVLEQTVKPFVEKINHIDELSCKTADMTCGSGIFLCETLRTLINKYIQLENPVKSEEEFKNKIKQLLIYNIFGNDINKEAIEIAKFSLFVTLLDYFDDPRDIENFAFPDISDNFFNYDVFDVGLNDDNNFVGPIDNVFGKGKKIEPDYIIGNPPWGEVKGSSYLENYELTDEKLKQLKEKELPDELLQICSSLKNTKYFEKKKFELEIKKHCINEELYKKNLSKIIKVSKNKSYTFKRATKERKKTSDIEIGNKEFAQAFLLRLSDFSAEHTVCQVIVTSKLLYNLKSDKFRNYYLHNFLINEVLEISSVRHQIFAGAVGPAAIIKYQYAFGKETKDNVIDYVSLKPNPYFAIFKSILIEKYDYKEIVQNELIKNDWLWKVLVYGQILDYRFIERLRNKEEFPIALGDLIEEKKNDGRPLSASVGIKIYQKGKGKEGNASHLKGLPFIQIDTKKTKRDCDLQRYLIKFLDKSIWTFDKVAEIRPSKNFLNPPILLLKKGLTKDFNIISSISDRNAVYTDGLYAIIQNNSTKLLECILGIMNSTLSQIIQILTGSSVGVEREQIMYEELHFYPIIENIDIYNKVKHLLNINQEISKYDRNSMGDSDKISDYEEQIQQTEDELNEIILVLYKLSDTERDLMSYAQEITIPILQAKSKVFREVKKDKRLYKPYTEVENPEINEYIKIFKEHFTKLHNGGESGYFNVKVIHSKNIIACEFSVDNEKLEDEWINLDSNEKALGVLFSLGFQKISNGLFIQKDIKTLKRNSFSVAKLNQYKYWHKAIARLDVIEFMESMIESRKSNSYVKS